MKQYDDEQAELETKIEAMEQELAEEKVGLLECSERVEKLFEDSSLKEFIENNQ